MSHHTITRRGFLRGLTTLPLIGGGVTLIGNPTKAAEPVTSHLLDCYDTWLFYERRFLRFERFGPGGDHGGWDEPYFTGTGFPTDFIIRYHIYRDVFPLMALGRYARATEGPVHRDEEGAS